MPVSPRSRTKPGAASRSTPGAQSGPHPRTQLLRTAERLFAERGIAAVSLREIAAEAGQRNTSAVAYHFGSKERLIEAILEYRMAPINAHRLQLVRAITDGRAPDDLRGWVEALVLPQALMLTASGEAGYYLEFLAEAQRHRRTGLDDLSDLDILEGMRITLSHLRRHMPGLPEAVVTDRLELLVSAVTAALAERERLLREHTRPVTGSARLLVAGLVDAGVGMLGAAMSGETRAEAERLHARGA